MNKLSAYDLEERTIRFAENVIELCKESKKDIISQPIITQLVRAATSIGANYAEANGASSKKDFKNKVFISKKECIETKYWLRILAKSEEKLSDKCRILWKECHELTLIFSKIAKSSGN
ncbi:MAG TPA: four helix bundle protein [Patescibacteria group bacterium]|nr:four helix bundle protein [Patescibacteria group bacterium]